MRRKFAGMALGAVAGCAEGTRGEPSLGCIEQRQQRVTGWPELAGTELPAAPEFGRERGRCCSVLEEWMKSVACSWDHRERGDALGRERQ